MPFPFAAALPFLGKALPILGGLAGGLFGGGKPAQQQSSFQTREFPGAFGASPESSTLAKMFQGILEQGQPQLPFGPTTQSEQSLIDSIIDQTQGQTAVRGLGPATQGSLAQAIAPTLVDFRNQQQEFGLDRRGQTIGGLESLLGLSMPQILGGETTTQTGATRGLTSKFGDAAKLTGSLQDLSGLIKQMLPKGKGV